MVLKAMGKAINKTVTIGAAPRARATAGGCGAPLSRWQPAATLVLLLLNSLPLPLLLLLPLCLCCCNPANLLRASPPAPPACLAALAQPRS